MAPIVTAVSSNIDRLQFLLSKLTLNFCSLSCSVSADDAELVIIAPSNPLVSIGPVMAVNGVRERLEQRRDTVVAVSPLVGGAALKGPAADMMRDAGLRSDAAGVATLYAPVAATMVIDTVDADLAGDVRAAGCTSVVTDTVMADPQVAARLAQVCVDAVVNRR